MFEICYIGSINILSNLLKKFDDVEAVVKLAFKA